jgi:hypothetical protein
LTTERAGNGFVNFHAQNPNRAGAILTGKTHDKQLHEASNKLTLREGNYVLCEMTDDVYLPTPQAAIKAFNS